jgi:hypothetical protein
MEPLLREVLLSEPDIVAWLEPPENTDDDEEKQRRAPSAR